MASDAMEAQPADAYAAISLRNQQQSPLLCLPAELRHKIYEYTLGGQRIRFVHLFSSVKVICQFATTQPPHEWRYRQRFLTLTQVCRQVHLETRSLPFTTNEFGGFPRAIVSGLSGLLDHAQANAITNLRITLDNRDLGRDRLDGFSKLLQVLQELDGLKQITVDWDSFFYPDSLGRYSIKNAEQEILQRFKQMKASRGDDVKIQLVYWSPGCSGPYNRY